MSSEKSFAKKLIPLVVFGGACLIAFVVAEVALRGIGFAYPVQTQSDFHLGYALVPDATWEHTSEGHSTVETNSFGFCDRPWVVEKPAGVKRIAVIGDSFVAALEVDRDKRFTNLIEAGLNSKNGEPNKIEVMNFGQPGFGTAQELMENHGVASNTMLHGFDNWKMGAGHWNEDGHRFAAAEILQWMDEG